MRSTAGASQRAGSSAGTAGSRRRRILDYIASQGGELRSDSGQGLRRQICDALGERPMSVSQALIAMEKAGLLEREIDVERRRCHAIRLANDSAGDGPADQSTAETPDRVGSVDAEDEELRAALDAAERDLAEAIRQAASKSRHVRDLRAQLVRVDNAPSPTRRPPGHARPAR